MGRLDQALLASSIVGDRRRRGMMFGVEIMEDRDAKTPGNQLSESIYYRCLDAGLSFKISQGCVLTVSPPMTICESDLDTALDIVESAILNAERWMGST